MKARYVKLKNKTCLMILGQIQTKKKKENVGFWETNSRSLKECHFKGKKKKEENMSPPTNHVKHPLVEGRCSLNSQET